MASNFQQNMQYGKLGLPGQLAKGFNVCWPIDSKANLHGVRVDWVNEWRSSALETSSVDGVPDI